jgi:type VI secretion system protein ImpF
MSTRGNDRVAPPLMHAFRAAHDKKDAKVRVDLRDGEGRRIIAARRPAGRAPISESNLRREVLADLMNLLNTTNMGSAEDLSATSAVRSSILNFGLPDLARRTIDENRLSDIAREIEVALGDFEPRLVRNSIFAQRDTTVSDDELSLRFQVKADLIARPLNVPVEFTAEVELGSGKIKIDRA